MQAHGGIVSSCSYYNSILQPLAALSGRTTLWAVVLVRLHAMPLLGLQVDCEPLQQELDDLTRKHEDLRRELRRRGKRKSEDRKRHRDVERVALAILCMTGGSRAAAKSFVERELGKHGAAVVTSACAAVCSTYDGMPEEERSDLREPTAPSGQGPVCRKAARFLKEYKLASWVETRNVREGIAPLTTFVTKQALAHGCLEPEPTSTTGKGNKQWLRRWRRRWDITLGHIAAREHVPPAEARQKALCPWSVYPGTSFWSIFGRTCT